MFYEQNKIEIYKNLDFSVESGCHQIKILAFLQNNLSGIFKQLIEGANTCKIVLSESYEDNISREIVNLLNDKLRESSDFLFRWESNKGPDILIFASPYKAFSKKLFVIEAKRLPPTSTQDYVRTGIGRFKREKHDQDGNIAAMLGYVQEDDFDHWYNKINSWINTLIPDENENPRWTADEQLSKIQTTEIGEYMSTHPRITKKPITLYHFWLNFCNSN